MAVRPGFEPDRPCREQRAVEEHPCALERKIAHRRHRQFGAAGPPREARPVDLADLRDERDERPPVAVERLRARAGPRRLLDAGRKLLEPAVRLRLAQERCDPLHLLRPERHWPREMNRASSNSPCNSSTRSRGAGVSIYNAISACPPCRVRETVMLAMFTTAFPNSVPTRPIPPGTSSYRKKTSSGASSMSSSNPRALTSHCRSSLPIVVPATRSARPLETASTRTRFVKSRDERRRSSRTSTPRSAAITGALT